MKKILILLLSLVLILNGCSNKDKNSANAVYDHVEFETLEELNEASGCAIPSILSLDVSDEYFNYISNSIAEYKFKADGLQWCIRASKDVDNDISGLHYDSIKFEKDNTSYYYTDDYYVYRTFANDIQYVISLNVKDNDISEYYFDGNCGDIASEIAGHDVGYDTELIEDGDDVIYRMTIYDIDGSTTIIDLIYSFKNDKMVSIKNVLTFDTEESAKEYYDELNSYGSMDNLSLKGNVISYEDNSSLEFYSDYSKAEFIDLMKSTEMDY